MATFIALALAASSAFAGDSFNTGGKNPILTPIEDGNPCYDQGWDWSVFVAGVFPDGGGEGAIGGGASLGYFFGKNFGLELGYAVFDTEPGQQHYSTLDMIYRFPFHNWNGWSPYIRMGGGVFSGQEVEAMARGGAGIELKLKRHNCMSFFMDGTYNWIQDQNNDFVARLGMKFEF